MSLFPNLLLEQIANSNEYLLGEFGVDTAENEPLEVWGKFNSIFIRLLRRRWQAGPPGRRDIAGAARLPAPRGTRGGQ